MDGLETCDYLVYPVEAALADKLCGIVEVHGRRASSRVKDLVDIAVYATTATVDGSGFQSRLRREASARRIFLGDSFGLPKAWGAPQARQYAKLCQRTGLPEALRNMEAASELAGRLLDPAIRGEAGGRHWNPEAREWE
ncbi:nucleotidyl transferase AbiEii/AbiGii toxin family protein [Parafannyhessea umbonata]|uniref:nucleotidyl transferase AbiEii/AbiGii toxin family protein n=1 Tax=Parafannyhessea umbonata TaxID=604330 RepID=UPI000AED575D|nr:nucleotidyl transferase AbiEii/AbiGii toxin family protein [Parafannyhessea umbonata]